MAEEKTAGGFWSSIPGVITAIAGLITAIAALVGALVAAGVIGPNSPGTTSSQPATMMREFENFPVAFNPGQPLDQKSEAI